MTNEILKSLWNFADKCKKGIEAAYSGLDVSHLIISVNPLSKEASMEQPILKRVWKLKLETIDGFGRVSDMLKEISNAIIINVNPKQHIITIFDKNDVPHEFYR